MTRTRTETAEVPGPDAASAGFGAGRGHLEAGAVARQIAPRRRDGRVAWRGSGRPKPCPSVDPTRSAPVEDSK